MVAAFRGVPREPSYAVRLDNDRPLATGHPEANVPGQYRGARLSFALPVQSVQDPVYARVRFEVITVFTSASEGFFLLGEPNTENVWRCLRANGTLRAAGGWVREGRASGQCGPFVELAAGNGRLESAG